jgi:cardiolipin synthase
MTDVAWLGTVVSILVAVAVIGVVLALVTDDREPSIVLAWLFLIVMVPLVGVVAYFFVGRNYRREPRRRVRQVGAPVATMALASVGAGAGGLAAPSAEKRAGSPRRRVEELGRREGGTEPVPAESIRLYFTGADKFRDLVEDLNLARDYVHLMYLIWEQDELTAQITDVLLERLRAGVEVNILYDWLSSSPYKKHELHRLAEAGAAVVPCYRRLRQLNYRNHMKMAIVDGRIVYSGGMNMGQEYIDGGSRFASWRDTHFRMTGPVVAPYLSLFAATWASNGRSEDLYAGHLPPSAPAPTGVPVQVLHSSVSTRFSTIRDAFMVALTSARERVWVQTPYFVPDEPLMTAMCVAAASGVDVRLMMTGLPDKKVPFYAAHAYFGKVLQAGVRVYHYDAGFLHAKTVTVDEELVLVGTCNWDIRSLILHDEAMAVVYDGPTARRFADQYLLDLASCHQVTAEAMGALGPVRSARNSVCRLMSRLL